MHASNLKTDIGPEDELAYFNIPLANRNGALDKPCPKCHQHGQWNIEIDLASFRCKRAICQTCYGMGWIETGTDLRAIPDIIRTAWSNVVWITRYERYPT